MTIGFVGLGIMGSRMALNLRRGGADLIVHNRTRAKAGPLLDAGAKWAETLRDVAAAEIVFTVLAHPQAVVAAARGAEGFLRHMRAGSVWVDCSTVHPGFSRELARAAAEHGVYFIDAPVVGTKPQAENAELVFFAGGESETIAQCQPYFDMMGQRVIHVGGHGMASALKIVANSLLASAMAAFAESVRLGRSLGLAQETLFDVLIGGPVVAPFVARKRDMLEQGDYEAQFPMRWMHKDLHMVAEAAYETGVATPLAAVSKEIYQLAIESGLGELDFSAIYRYYNGSRAA